MLAENRPEANEAPEPTQPLSPSAARVADALMNVQASRDRVCAALSRAQACAEDTDGLSASPAEVKD
jgi:hypothetical protein